MRYRFFVSLAAAAALAVSASADVIVATPWVTVHVGRPAVPAPPPTALYPGDPPPVPIPPPEPVTVAPTPAVETPAPVLVRPPTLEEFACSFHPAPGHYEVVLMNPETCCPTKVCFDLPCGCPTVRVHDKSLVFHYGLLHNVTIRFRHDGSVAVRD
ncbi:MAG TPA: hypothetical protein VMS17_13815 [Gemmataceae bacterium]|nr:hypothetical protein [Gemmataceae bacterium]